VDAVIAKYRPRIEAICPGLVWSSATVNRDGVINDVIIVNDEVVFRFAKGKEGIRMFAHEARILARVRDALSVAVPDPFYTSDDTMAYRALPGRPLLRAELLSLSDHEQQQVADAIATMLRQLHAVDTGSDLPATSAPVKRETWLKIRHMIEKHVYPLLMTHQRFWAEALFERYLRHPGLFEWEPCLVHGDLGFHHLLFRGAPPRPHGVIDFGAAGVGDPAIDLAPLCQAYGESFVSRFAAAYPASTELLPRARFYAQAIELMWAATGISKAEPFWHLAHLGGARDLEA
jgi:aminoglycoside 2''-phosphotransferase